jgi:hypothetical protein
MTAYSSSWHIIDSQAVANQLKHSSCKYNFNHTAAVADDAAAVAVQTV